MIFMMGIPISGKWCLSGKMYIEKGPIKFYKLPVSVAIIDIPLKLIVKLKYCEIAYVHNISVAKLFWNFVQSTAMILLSCVYPHHEGLTISPRLIFTWLYLMISGAASLPHH